MAIFLTLKEVAELKKCNYEIIKKQVQRGTLKAIEVKANGKGGKGGKQYKVALENLADKYQVRYWDMVSEKLRSNKEIHEIIEVDKNNDFSLKERNQISYWKKLLSDWNNYRFANRGKKDVNGMVIRDSNKRSHEFIEAYNLQHPDKKITHKSMVRRNRQYKEQGDVALIDKRGKCNKGRSSIPDEAWKVFCTYYLQEKQFDPAYCYKWTKNWAYKNDIEIPTLRTFTRHIDTIPATVLVRRRQGKTAFNDIVAPYLERDYTHLESNDVWIADNHKFDFISSIDGKNRRFQLTLYIDARSRKPMCWGVFENPNADTNLAVFRQGIIDYGVPKAVYTDNGRDFLALDITGPAGYKYRKSKEVEEENKVPSIFEEMGIEIIVAKPAKGQEKPVERTFRTVKQWFSKTFATYIGGHVLERPEESKKYVKDDKYKKTLEEVTELTRKFIEGYLPFQEHNGNGMDGRNSNEVYYDCLGSIKKATKEQIRHLLVRRSRALTVQQNGVTVNYGYAKLTYHSTNLIHNHFKEKVYVRYNANDLTKIDIYDMNDVLIEENVTEKKLGKFAGKDIATREALKENSKKYKKLQKLEREYYENNTTKVVDPIDLIVEEAEKNMEEFKPKEPTVIQPLIPYNRANNLQVQEQKMAVGAEDTEVIIDWERMISNARKQKRYD
ncbi:DNA-binding domain-containing protein [Vallitalea guaymasensis]|uniref:DNA-binding domain-containing protein n=1 Tax=Vallitalea guaymasensis TaxID=1185412 RepID=UPI000DE24ACC|nr:DNA-binding domain-containing protein [Vallitalea guaymasensis]